ncbi:MAG: hypothetical protein H7321_00565, partial [Bacteroidia bacterium]|nr:hypothetical protein [Bacteroidia bacterium]
FLKEKSIQVKQLWGKSLMSGLLIFAIFEVLLLGDIRLFPFLYVVLAPFIIMWLVSSVYFTNNIISGFGKMLELCFSGFLKMYGLYIIYIVTSTLAFIFTFSPVSWLVIYLLDFNVELSDDSYTLILKLILAGAILIILAFTIIYFVISFIFYSFSTDEVLSANTLHDKIEKLGTAKKAYGLETE